MDYLKKLSDAELKFMNQFMAEYVSGGNTAQITSIKMRKNVENVILVIMPELDVD